MAREPHISVTASPAERASLAKSRNRYRLACLAFAVSFLAIAVRLVTLGFAAVEPGGGGIHDISTTVHRPDILDRNGRLLATDIKGATLYADPAKVEKWFKRNCNEVLGRACTPLEKGDWLSFMRSQ